MKKIIILFATVLLSCCASTSISQHGDARLERRDRITTFDLFHSANTMHKLDFPSVTLTRPGTVIFRVRGIKPGMIPTEVTLRYPKHSNLSQRDMIDQWGDAMFRLRITAIGQNNQFAHTFDLTETNWDYNSAISDRAHFTKPLTGYPFNKEFQTEEWSKVTDYDVEVTVLKPTNHGSHQVELTGIFYDFFHKPNN